MKIELGIGKRQLSCLFTGHTHNRKDSSFSRLSDCFVSSINAVFICGGKICIVHFSLTL